MIKEFAVEPAAIVESYRVLCYVIEKFGISEGRVISEFPSKWKRLVFQAAQQEHGGKAELAKIEERLRRLPKDALISWARPAEVGDWLEIAKIEHQRQPFDWVLTKTMEVDERFVSIDTWDATHSSLQPVRQLRVARTAGEMAMACKPLLSITKHAKFVDPHFDLNNRRFQEPLTQFFQCLPDKALVEIFVDGQEFNARSYEHLRHGAGTFFARVLNRGIEVKLWGHTGIRMHNRYVLTPAGGLLFGCGLDVAEGDATPNDEVTLLQENIRSTLWAEFNDGDLIGEWST